MRIQQGLAIPTRVDAHGVLVLRTRRLLKRVGRLLLLSPVRLLPTQGKRPGFIWRIHGE